tara:strand:+ start:400 stop:603 length:204 start_codon:yes stop_codon:yes gene_type:complete
MDYRLSKIVNLIRGLNEEPTMSLSGGKIAGTKEAGDLPPVNKKKKKNIYLGIGSRTQWLRNVKKNGK